MWATDVSSASLAVAQENAQRHSVADRVHFLQGDLFFPLHNLDLTFDLIVSNPPYIADNDIPTLQPEVRNWEPRGALDGGHDGLDFYRRLLAEGPQYLHSGGWLVMEIGHGQQSEVLRLARQQPTLAAACDLDYEGHERVVRVQKGKDRVPAETWRPD
jgi:release factor glutamine methyltransferase